MKTMHVRIEHEESLDGKKQLLSSEMNILELLKRVKNYKISRKRELILKNRLKQEFKKLSSEISRLLEILPKTERTKTRKTKEGMSKAEISHQKSIEYQLQEIREKLARLNR